MTLLVSLPLSFALGGMIEEHLGRSLAADAAAAGTDYDWWQEFSAQATGLGTTFVPSIVGFGAVLDNLDSLLDNQRLAVTIAGATCAWLVIWSFLSGGVIDRLARARPTRSARLLRGLRDALLAVRAAWTSLASFIYAAVRGRPRAGSSTRSIRV